MEAEPRIPTAIEGLETFSFAEEDDDGEEKKTEDFSDAESFFNLPDNAGDDEDDDEKSWILENVHRLIGPTGIALAGPFSSGEGEVLRTFQPETRFN